jgi:hypothetical protein
MAEQAKVKYGVDELTFSLNDNAQNKTEDWHSDWNGKVVINGVTYYLNGYRKNDQWIAGRLKEAPQKDAPVAAAQPAQASMAMDDEVPF